MRIRALLVACSLVAGLFVFAVPASAGTDFCTALQKFDVSSSNTGASSTAEEAAASRDAFKQLAKADAPANVKKAVLRIASFYDAIASSKGNAARALTAKKRIKDYSKGYKVFIKYYSSKCLAVPGGSK